MRRAGAGRACIFWQNDCRRRMRGRQVSKSCHSGVICSLGQWFLVARAEIASPAFLSIGCGTDRFHHSSVRVRLSAGAGEHAPSDKLVCGGACRTGRSRRSAIQVSGYGAQPHGNPKPFGRARGGWKRELSAARVGLAGPAVLPFECRGMGACPHVHPCPCPYNLAYQNAKALV